MKFADKLTLLKKGITLDQIKELEKEEATEAEAQEKEEKQKQEQAQGQAKEQEQGGEQDQTGFVTKDDLDAAMDNLLKAFQDAALQNDSTKDTGSNDRNGTDVLIDLVNSNNGINLYDKED